MSTINSVFFLSLLSPLVTFLPEGVIIGFRNFAWGLSHKKRSIWGELKFEGPSLPCGGSNFLEFKKTKQKLKYFNHPSRTRAPIFLAFDDGGLSGGSSVRTPGIDDPHRRQRNFIHVSNIFWNILIVCGIWITVTHYSPSLMDPQVLTHFENLNGKITVITFIRCQCHSD